ncbi:MAG: hypothetical protein DMD45_10825 [Gemmatimonadetes bacterium]|nr:MAG: hypothetical protein DMD45_10825 [Gemmatimonadota bacterium]
MPWALTLLAVLPSARLAAQTIDTIVVVRHNVYDRKRDAPKVVAAVGNALHITTHAWVVRRALLVRAGDRYDSAKVVESERALRALTIFRAVRIDTVRVAGRLALRVETDDAWSTIPDFDYASVAGDVLWAVAFTEGNLLGTGTALTGRYEKTPDRHSVSVGYNSTGVLGRRTVLATQYKTISDGRSGTWSIGVPFYETVAPRSLTTDGTAAKERVLRFKDGLLLDSLQHRELRVGVSGGVALRASAAGYLRLWAGAAWRREDFAAATTVPFPRSRFGTLGAGLELKRVRFQVLENFNSFARQEDVDLSQTLHLGLWAAPRAWGYGPGRAGVGPEVSGQLSGAWNRGFAVLRGQAAGVLTGVGVDSGRVIGSVTVASQDLPRQSLILHVEGGALRGPKQGDEFDLWRDSKGPRLFGAHAFTGTRMAWVALEDRAVVKDEVWGLFGIGLAPFLDYGGAWYDNEPTRLGGDAGLALRLGPTRLTITDVGQFALGYRFGKGFSGRHWAFTAAGNIAY